MTREDLVVLDIIISTAIDNCNWPVLRSALLEALDPEDILRALRKLQDSTGMDMAITEEDLET